MLRLIVSHSSPPADPRNGISPVPDIWKAITFCTVSILLLAGIVLGTHATSIPPEQEQAARVKAAEGQYTFIESANGGAVGPFQEEIYGFQESWTLWRVGKERYQVDGVRRFESPKDELHSNRFIVDLTRDLTIIRAKEFAKLKWVADSGPLSCEFLPMELDCSSGGSDPKKEIKVRTPMNKPYGLLWPISPFSFTGIGRQVERDPALATDVELVQIEQPSMANPVQAGTLEGPLRYMGEENIEEAGRKWRAHKFSLKLATRPQFLIWTSARGLLLALAVEHEHSNWPEEGMRLTRFESEEEF